MHQFCADMRSRKQHNSHHQAREGTTATTEDWSVLSSGIDTETAMTDNNS